MPTTLRNTDILFNDGTTQSTAAGVPSSFNAVGSLVHAVNFSASNLLIGNTIAGSSLLIPLSTGILNFSSVAYSQTDFRIRGERNGGNFGAFQPSNTQTLPGTWRLLSVSSPREASYSNYSDSTFINYYGALVQRIS